MKKFSVFAAALLSIQAGLVPANALCDEDHHVLIGINEVAWSGLVGMNVVMDRPLMGGINLGDIGDNTPLNLGRIRVDHFDEDFSAFQKQFMGNSELRRSVQEVASPTLDGFIRFEHADGTSTGSVTRIYGSTAHSEHHINADGARIPSSYNANHLPNAYSANSYFDSLRAQVRKNLGGKKGSQATVYYTKWRATETPFPMSEEALARLSPEEKGRVIEKFILKNQIQRGIAATIGLGTLAVMGDGVARVAGFGTHISDHTKKELADSAASAQAESTTTGSASAR